MLVFGVQAIKVTLLLVPVYLERKVLLETLDPQVIICSGFSSVCRTNLDF